MSNIQILLEQLRPLQPLVPQIKLASISLSISLLFDVHYKAITSFFYLFLVRYKNDLDSPILESKPRPKQY